MAGERTGGKRSRSHVLARRREGRGPPGPPGRPQKPTRNRKVRLVTSPGARDGRVATATATAMAESKISEQRTSSGSGGFVGTPKAWM